MKGYPLFRPCLYATNLLVVASLVGIAYSAAWEFSTRSYLRGFSDAVIPASDTPQEKVEAIFDWMKHGPGRRAGTDETMLAGRNPEVTLNYQALLAVCGTATNAFVNLASSSGMQVRRLLLLDENRNTKHVVAEVWIDGRWVVADPSYHTMLRDPSGRLLTRAELADPAVFRSAAESISNYPLSYTYERTAHVHLHRVLWVGRYLRSTFTAIWPNWEESINWTLLVERESFAMLVASCFLLGFALAARLALGWYSDHRLGIACVRLRDHFLHVGNALSSKSK